MAVDQQLIQQARQANLPSYLLSRGEPLVKNGQGYSHKVHDSLKITRNMYCWNSKGTKGNSLSFLQEFYNMTFLEAVQELTGEQTRQAVPYVPVPHEHKELVMPDKDVDVKRVYAYLVQTRKIDKSVLQLCFDNHSIYQDDHGNVVFRMKDIDGNVVGAEIRGTSPTKYTGIASGSKYGYGFNISIGAKCDRMCIFESSIDLLSYITLYRDKLNSIVLVSMAGLKEHTLINMAKLHNIELNNVWCCVDRDSAGIQFADNMRVKYGTKIHLPPVEVKDWNEIITSK